MANCKCKKLCLQMTTTKNLIVNCLKIVLIIIKRHRVVTFQTIRDNRIRQKLITLGATFTFHKTQIKLHPTSTVLYLASVMNNISRVASCRHSKVSGKMEPICWLVVLRMHCLKQNMKKVPKYRHLEFALIMSYIRNTAKHMCLLFQWLFWFIITPFI